MMKQVIRDVKHHEFGWHTLKGWMDRHRDALILFNTLMVLATLTLSVIIWTQQRTVTTKIHNSQVETLKGLKDLLSQQITNLNTEIKQTKSLDQAALFPNFPPKQLRELIRQGQQRRHMDVTDDTLTLTDLRAVPSCEARYK
jgi:hypothetical protein